MADARRGGARSSDSHQADPILRVTDLVVAYGDTTAVDGLSFAVRRGEVFGLLGPNGAGKTSTLRGIQGLIRPRGGTIVVDGHDVEREPFAVKASLGVRPQAPSFRTGLSIQEIARLYAGLYGVVLADADIVERMRSCGLVGERRKPFKALSGGQQQRFSLLIAVIHDAPLLLLDEPTAGLDPQSRRNLWDHIGRLQGAGGSVLLTTHSMEEAQAVCARLAIIDHGKLLTLSTLTELIASYRSDPRVLAVAHGEVTLEDVFIALTGSEIRA